MPWQDIPEAAGLLASIAADPPEQRYVRGAFGPNDGRMEYADERVTRLNRIHRDESERLWNRDREAFSEHCLLSVQDAIANAIDRARFTKKVLVA